MMAPQFEQAAAQIASRLAIRVALKVEPAEAIGG